MKAVHPDKAYNLERPIECSQMKEMFFFCQQLRQIREHPSWS